jgi:hypothetical protein
MGLVSRVLPVHTAVRNGTGDEGGPFEVGNQVLTSSHRKLLSSKAMVVNVAEGVLRRPKRHPACRRREAQLNQALVRNVRALKYLVHQPGDLSPETGEVDAIGHQATFPNRLPAATDDTPAISDRPTTTNHITGRIG